MANYSDFFVSAEQSSEQVELSPHSQKDMIDLNLGEELETKLLVSSAVPPPIIEDDESKAMMNVIKPGFGNMQPQIPTLANNLTSKQVCYHWLKDKCRKGDSCEYLHERIEELIPLCRFYPNCQNDKCEFRHVDTQPECPFYARGFCKLGPYCSNKHVEKRICPNYAYGFCPKGPECPLFHPKSIIRPEDQNIQTFSNFCLPNFAFSQRKGSLQGPGTLPPLNKSDSHQHRDFFETFTSIMADNSENRQRKTFQKQPPICFRCGETGHKEERCFNPPPDPETLEYRLNRPEVKKRFENIQCKKCLQYGHYAHQCPTKKRPPSQMGMPGQNAYFPTHP